MNSQLIGLPDWTCEDNSDKLLVREAVRWYFRTCLPLYAQSVLHNLLPLCESLNRSHVLCIPLIKSPNSILRCNISFVFKFLPPRAPCAPCVPKPITWFFFLPKYRWDEIVEKKNHTFARTFKLLYMSLKLMKLSQLYNSENFIWWCKQLKAVEKLHYFDYSDDSFLPFIYRLVY